jgi:hypothetical protein
MLKKLSNDLHVFEVTLTLIILGLNCLLYQLDGYMMVALNLFYIPVVLSGFFLGRYSAGVFALFSMCSASCIVALNATGFAATTSPLVIGLSVIVWGASLGLTALLVGTLSDERAARLKELHEAYVGVLEVLSTYLQKGNPGLKARSLRVAELSQKIAGQLYLSSKQVDDIRVAALLQDVGNLEITTRVMKRALSDLELGARGMDEATFDGLDLVQSLSVVLSGAVPLLSEVNDMGTNGLEQGRILEESSIGAHIIQIARAFDALVVGRAGADQLSPKRALEELRRAPLRGLDVHVMNALERVIASTMHTPDAEGRRHTESGELEYASSKNGLSVESEL